jgi:hypothetical protein
MDCTWQLQCAKLGFFFELRKKKVGKSSKNVEFSKKQHKYLCISKIMRTFAPANQEMP